MQSAATSAGWSEHRHLWPLVKWSAMLYLAPVLVIAIFGACGGGWGPLSKWGWKTLHGITAVAFVSHHPPHFGTRFPQSQDDDSSALSSTSGETSVQLGATDGESMPAIPGWLVERSIYIPYEKLSDTFERQKRGVFVPYEEFDRLWDLARQAMKPEKVEPPPRSGIIVESLSRADATRERLVVSSALAVEFLKPGWHEVPLALADASLRQATVEGEPARIVRTASGQNAWLVHIDQVPARRTLSLEYAKAVTSSGGQYHVSLAIPSSAVNRWEVSVDERDVDISLTPAAVVTKQASPDQETSSSITAIVGNAAEITLRWTPRAVGAERLSAIVTAESATEISVQKNLVRLNQRLALSIQRSNIGQLHLRIPDGFEVVAVTSDFVKRWEKDPAQANLLKLEFFEELRGDQALELALEMQLSGTEATELTLASVEVVEATRQPGTLELAADVGLGIEIASLMGLVRTHMSADDSGSRRWTFRYTALPFLLKVTATELKPLVRGIQSIDANLNSQWLTSDIVWLLEIQQAGVFSIPLELPEGVEVVRVVGFQWSDYQPVVVDQISTIEGSSIRHVQLSRQALGKIGLWLTVRQPTVMSETAEEGPDSSMGATWPQLAAGFAEYVTGQIRIALPESLLVTPGVEPGLRPMDARQFKDYTGRTTESASLAYEFVQRSPGLPLTLKTRKPQIMVDWYSEWAVEPGLVRQTGELSCEVRFSPVKSLRIDIPNSIAGQVRIETPGWRTSRMEPQPDDIAAGYQAWTLQGGNELIGTHIVRITWDQPLAEVEVGESISVPIVGIAPRGVDRSRGQIVVRRSELFDLRVAEGAKGLRPIEPTTDLFGNRAVHEAVVALEYAADWNLALIASRLELFELKRTNIPRALVRAVWLRQGQLSVQAVYQVRGVHQRLRIIMPPDFDPDTGFDQNPVRVDGQNVSIERGVGNELSVSLGNRDREKTLLVELRYTIPVRNGQIMVPTFPDDCAVQKTVLCVYIPPELAPWVARGPWTDTFAFDRPDVFDRVFQLRYQDDRPWLNWISNDTVNATELAKFETDGRAYLFSTLQPTAGPAGALQLPLARRNLMNIAIIGLVGVVGLVLLRFSWRTRLVVTSVAVAAFFLVMLVMPIITEPLSLQFTSLMIFLIGAVWVVSSVLQASQRLRRTPPNQFLEHGAASELAVKADSPQTDEPLPPPTANSESKEG
ncbi:MAG TPA: hypothetical protein PKD54_07430 [Pirellulaceae bacterium]|mgnify:CR=1 FL=1|nr:hypothetical protein [Pirellulaceae bacterium]